MLYLNSAYFVIDGISIFPDHADPLLFYYLPMMPKLSTAKDASGADMPVIQLIEYEGAAGTGGFIDFDVNIGVSDDALNAVKQKLQQQAHLSDTPRLSPVTFVDGTVRLLILGTDTGNAPPAASKPAASPPPSGVPQFVIKAQSAGKPSLYGDNQATFSVQLDQYGATVLEAALKGDLAPIAVVYSLDFVGLRPAFHVHLHVDWNRVQTHVDDTFHAGVLFFSSDIEKMVDKLIEDQVVTIDVDTFVTDEDGGKQVSGDRDRAVAEVYEMIKNTFFESSLPPPNPNQPDGWDRAMGAFQQVSAMALTGGWASVASFSKKSVDLTRIDQKVLDVNISERTAVQRTIYPQGHLSGLLQTLKTTGASADRFIIKVDLDNPWFQRRHVNVVSHADFDTDQIELDRCQHDLQRFGEVGVAYQGQSAERGRLEQPYSGRADGAARDLHLHGELYGRGHDSAPGPAYHRDAERDRRHHRDPAAGDAVCGHGGADPSRWLPLGSLSERRGCLPL